MKVAGIDESSLSCEGDIDSKPICRAKYIWTAFKHLSEAYDCKLQINITAFSYSH